MSLETNNVKWSYGFINKARKGLWEVLEGGKVKNRNYVIIVSKRAEKSRFAAWGMLNIEYQIYAIIKKPRVSKI